MANSVVKREDCIVPHTCCLLHGQYKNIAKPVKMGGFLSRRACKRKECNAAAAPETEEDVVIDRIVDRYIANDRMNNRLIPDAIERRIYRNLLKMVLGAMQDTVGHARMEFLGHEVTVTMRPVMERQQHNSAAVIQ